MVEKIILIVCGISPQGLNTLFKYGGYETFGAGKTFHVMPNSLFITDKRVMAIAVPVEGEGAMVQGFNISMWHNLLNKNGIEKEANLMAKSLSPEQILKSHVDNYYIDFEKISRIKVNTLFRRTITFETLDKKRYIFAISDKSDLVELRSVLKKYFPNIPSG